MQRHDIKNKNGTPLILGVSPKGLYAFRLNNLLQPVVSFSWAECAELAFADKKFTICVRGQRLDRSPLYWIYAFVVYSNLLSFMSCALDRCTTAPRVTLAFTSIAAKRANVCWTCVWGCTPSMFRQCKPGLNMHPVTCCHGLSHLVKGGKTRLQTGSSCETKLSVLRWKSARSSRRRLWRRDPEPRNAWLRRVRLDAVWSCS